MSFLVKHEKRPSKRRKKHDSGFAQNSESKYRLNSSYDDVMVIGYHSKIFRDDVMAKYIEDGKHLIPWMGDESLLIDRYDCRGYLYSHADFEGPIAGGNFMSPDEELIENECDKFRYFGLNLNEVDQDILQEELSEEDTKSLSKDGSYANISYHYDNEPIKDASGDQEYDPNECFDSYDFDQESEHKKPGKEPLKHVQISLDPKQESNKAGIMYEKPDNLEIPEGMDMPDSQKSHSIIEKTASFISKHGAQMEIILKAKQAGNPQFDFLNFGNWLNPYYKLILSKIKEGTYKVHEEDNDNENERKEDTQDSKSGSGSDSGSDDEYIHPLLQAHRRPIKTQGDISDPENAEQGASDDSSVLNRNNVVSYLMQRQLPNSVYSNAAEVYMARKYEHLRKDILNDKDFAIGKNKNITDDNWADQLEEDKHFSLFEHYSHIDDKNQQNMHVFGMMQVMHPPPPPPSSNLSLDHQIQSAQSSRTLPPPPPPPGCTEEDPSRQILSLEPQQQHPQMDHIVPPPPDLKSVVDKLAEYVSRNGEVFEKQIKQKNDPRFQFLIQSNIYHPYYLYKKQQCIMGMNTSKTSLCESDPGKIVKPLSFALKTTKKTKANEKMLKSVEIFDSNLGDLENEHGEEMEDNLDGYRPNKVKREANKRELTIEEKAKETMEKAKIMIAEAQKKQRELQESVEGGGNNPEIQMERRRKAAAFIGMLKKANESDIVSSSSESSSDEEEAHDNDDENSAPKRHFTENKVDE